MKILNLCYYGLMARCNNCGCLIGYEPDDVTENQNINCPRCKFTLWVPFNSKYDGLINDDTPQEKTE